jgi:hypothetical protein
MSKSHYKDDTDKIKTIQTGGYCGSMVMSLRLRKGMWFTKQAARRHLITGQELAPHGFYIHYFPGLWRHKTEPTLFTLRGRFRHQICLYSRRHTPEPLDRATNIRSIGRVVTILDSLSNWNYKYKWVRISMPYYRQGINPIQHKHRNTHKIHRMITRNRCMAKSAVRQT